MRREFWMFARHTAMYAALLAVGFGFLLGPIFLFGRWAAIAWVLVCMGALLAWVMKGELPWRPHI